MGIRFLRILLYGITLTCVISAVFGTKPWQTHVAERHAEGRPAKLEDYLTLAQWEDAVFLGIVSLGLASTMRFWANRRVLPVLPLVEPKAGISNRVFWLALGVICLAALPSRMARMDDSFWGDEAWAYNDLLHGRMKVNEADGSLSFQRHPWMLTAFYDKSTNNHYLYSLSARVCDEIWRKAKDAKPYEFSEESVRVPPLLAGIGSLVAIAALLRRIGYAEAGLTVAVILALHPWHVRYCSEARGYTMLILFLILSLLALIPALEKGRWRWWLTYAVMQFFALYTWKAAVHPVAVMNVVAAVIIVRQRGWHVVGMTQLTRWAIANVVTLSLFVPLFAPAIPQIARKLQHSQQWKGEMGPEWLRDLWAQLCGGMDWANGEYSSDSFVSVTRISEQFPWFEPFVAIVIPVLVVLGLLIVLWNRADYGAIVAAPLIGALLGLAHFKLSGNEMLKWYLFYTLPFVFAFLAVALTSFGSRWVRFAPAGIFLLAYFLTAGQQLSAVVRNSFQDPRGATELTRYRDEGRHHMGPSNIVTVGLYRRCVLYDPRMTHDWKGKPLRTPELLKEVMSDCDKKGRVLRVTVANMGFARVANSGFMALLDDTRLFKPIGVFPAGEDYISIYAWEYESGSLAASASRDGM